VAAHSTRCPPERRWHQESYNCQSVDAKGEIVVDSPNGIAEHVKMEDFDGKEGLENLVTESDVIFCTTPSTSPLFPALYLTSEGARSKTCFISAIGSYRLDMAEIDPELLQSIITPSDPFASQVYNSCIVVDSIKGCMDEAGELLKAGLEGEQMLEVGKIDGLREGSEKEEVQKWLEEGFVVYKSVGVAIMDIAIGKALMELAV
jgi:phosphoribosylformylglycinamidine synthase